MRIVVGGDFRHPILLDTKNFSNVLIETDDGRPAVIYKILSDGKGFLRLTRGEDSNFEEQVSQLLN